MPLLLFLNQMKKILFFLFACFAAINLNAQIADRPIKESFDLTSYGQKYYIPTEFAYNGVTSFVYEQGSLYSASGAHFSVINEDLQTMHTFNINIDYDNNYKELEDISGMVDGKSLYSRYFTQTFFNDDEKIEYVLQGSGTYFICNEDGKVLHTIKASDYGYEYWEHAYYVKFNTKNYFVVYVEIDRDEYGDEIYDYLYFPIDKSQPNSISAHPTIVKGAKKMFDMSGKEISNARRGVNIIRNEDGTVQKRLMK